MRRVAVAVAVAAGLAAIVVLAPSLGGEPTGREPGVTPGPVATAVTSLAGGPTAGVTRRPRLVDWRPHVRRARRYADGRAGSVSFALRTRRRVYGLRRHAVAVSASVVKAMLLVTYLNSDGVRRRRLNDADRALLAPMIRWSDNDAASRVRDIVGNGALEHLARRVGMRNFASSLSWGSTLITAADQAKLFMRIDRCVVRRHRDYAMRLLRTVIPAQQWGIGRARPPAWALYLKGGWGSGSGAVDHQVALLRRGRRRLALAILTTGNPSHEYGTETLEGVARRLLRGLGPRSRPR